MPINDAAPCGLDRLDRALLPPRALYVPAEPEGASERAKHDRPQAELQPTARWRGMRKSRSHTNIICGVRDCAYVNSYLQAVNARLCERGLAMQGRLAIPSATA